MPTALFVTPTRRTPGWGPTFWSAASICSPRCGISWISRRKAAAIGTLVSNTVPAFLHAQAELVSGFRIRANCGLNLEALCWRDHQPEIPTLADFVRVDLAQIRRDTEADYCAFRSAYL